MSNSANRFLYSIGHGARKLEDFLALLQQYHILYLADVRSIPQSRFHPQYNRAALERALADVGIRYVFMGDTLGGRPSDKALLTMAGKPDYGKMSQAPAFHTGIRRLVKAAAQGLPLAIMCSERDPRQCHRARLIAPPLLDLRVEVRHIDIDGRLISQDQLFPPHL